MAGRRELKPNAADFPSTTAASLNTKLGTNYPFGILEFDAAADEAAFWTFRVSGYTSGNLTLDIYWMADTATTGNIVWGGAIAAVTPETDTQDVTTDGLATENTVTDSHLGTTARREHKATVTISNLDSLADGDNVTLRLRRLGSNGSDTMAGDAWVRYAEVSWS